jgi:peptide/nickel transport system permease protein
MIILWTDALIFLLLAVISIALFMMLNKPHFKRPLAKITHSKTGMASLMVLLVFISIGVIDSIHYKDAKDHEVISFLDQLARPLTEHMEKTYSAPFSAYLYSKEMMTLADGRQVWGYPRLKFGAAHLNNPEQEKWRDVMIKAVIGFAQGAAGCLLMYGICWYCYRHAAWFKRPATQTAFITLFILISLLSMLAYLSAWYHVLGTDKVGEDVFYQSLKSIRTGLVIGTLTTMMMLPLAIGLGIMAGFFRGWVDDLIQFIYTTLNSIPGVLLIAASILMVQVYMSNHPEQFTSLLVRADMRLLFLCMILGVTSWTGLCRMLRAETLKLREMEFVLAAESLGVTRGMILFRHILPNVMHIVLISVVLDFSALVLAEAVLSYINIGVDPTTYSWGNMINGARLEMARDPVVWWSLAAAFLFMFSLVLAANLFADTVRNAFDPRRVGHG